MRRIGVPEISVRSWEICPRDAGAALLIVRVSLPILYAAAPNDRAGERRHAQREPSGRPSPIYRSGVQSSPRVGPFSRVALSGHGRRTLRNFMASAMGRTRPEPIQWHSQVRSPPDELNSKRSRISAAGTPRMAIGQARRCGRSSYRPAYGDSSPKTVGTSSDTVG